MSVLEVTDLSIRFGGLQALEGLNVSVNEWEIVGLIGPNGAGKTTAFNCITGFYKPDTGSVVYRGVDITRMPPHEKAAIGFYLSSHPLAQYEVSLKRLGVTRAADLPALLQRGVAGRIKLAGTVIDRMERNSAKGNRFAFVSCSDQSGAFELMVFSEVLSAKRNLLEAGQAVLISVDGRLDGEQVKLMAQSVEKL